MVTRRQWGARGVVPIDLAPKHRMAIHHTVSPNRLWTKSQEKAHVRQIESSHIGQGWSTVGYSWLVFPSGRVYEGRGERGLPAAQGGENSGSWAISFVLNGEQKAPSLLARRSARRIIKNRRGRLRKLGGHQEFPGQATACPGRKTMPYVKKWRSEFKLSRP